MSISDDEVEAAWRVLKDAYFPGARNNSKNMAPVRAALSAAAKVRAIREGDGDWPLKARVWFRESTNEKVLEIQGTIDGTFGIWRHTQPGDTPNDEVPSLAASPIPATTGGVK